MWPRARARRQVLPGLLVEQHQPGRIALLRQQVGERRRQVARVGQLRHALAPVAHRRRRIDEQERAHLRLVLEALDVVAVDAADRLPVDAADVVAGRVLLVLGELDRRAGVRVLVHARERALDDHARAHAHRPEARDVHRDRAPAAGGAAAFVFASRACAAITDGSRRRAGRPARAPSGRRPRRGSWAARGAPAPAPPARGRPRSTTA